MNKLGKSGIISKQSAYGTLMTSNLHGYSISFY